MLARFELIPPNVKKLEGGREGRLRYGLVRFRARHLKSGGACSSLAGEAEEAGREGRAKWKTTNTKATKQKNIANRKKGKIKGVQDQSVWTLNPINRVTINKVMHA